MPGRLLGPLSASAKALQHDEGGTRRRHGAPRLVERLGKIAAAHSRRLRALPNGPATSGTTSSEIVEERTQRRSTLLTSQLDSQGVWHQAFGDPTLADAVLDRLVHNAYRLELEGDSMRAVGTARRS